MNLIACCSQSRAAEKADAEGDAEEEAEDNDEEGDGEKKKKPKKKKGGIQVPEDWPWEAAKKLFETPDVTPAKDLDVRPFFACVVFDKQVTDGCDGSSSGECPT